MTGDTQAIWDALKVPDVGPPLPARVELGRAALDSLRAAVGSSSPTGLVVFSVPLYGVPVVLDDSLPDGGWRVIGHDGQVLSSGGGA